MLWSLANGGVPCRTCATCARLQARGSVVEHIIASHRCYENTLRCVEEVSAAVNLSCDGEFEASSHPPIGRTGVKLLKRYFKREGSSYTKEGVRVIKKKGASY